MTSAHQLSLPMAPASGVRRKRQATACESHAVQRSAEPGNRGRNGHGSQAGPRPRRRIVEVEPEVRAEGAPSSHGGPIHPTQVVGESPPTSQGADRTAATHRQNDRTRAPAERQKGAQPAGSQKDSHPDQLGRTKGCKRQKSAWSQAQLVAANRYASTDSVPASAEASGCKCETRTRSRPGASVECTLTACVMQAVQGSTRVGAEPARTSESPNDSGFLHNLKGNAGGGGAVGTNCNLLQLDGAHPAARLALSIARAVRQLRRREDEALRARARTDLQELEELLGVRWLPPVPQRRGKARERALAELRRPCDQEAEAAALACWAALDAPVEMYLRTWRVVLVDGRDAKPAKMPKRQERERYEKNASERAPDARGFGFGMERA